MGQHSFRYALFPFIGHFSRPSNADLNLIQAAYQFNCPVRHIEGIPPQDPFLTISNPAVILETSKIAEDGKDIILRLYESFGATADALISFNSRVYFNDFLFYFDANMFMTTM